MGGVCCPRPSEGWLIIVKKEKEATKIYMRAKKKKKNRQKVRKLRKKNIYIFIHQ